jgi:hypothetical protein
VIESARQGIAGSELKRALLYQLSYAPNRAASAAF